MKNTLYSWPLGRVMLYSHCVREGKSVHTLYLNPTVIRIYGTPDDAILRLQEAELRVNKNILSRYSPYFSALFGWSLGQMEYTITGFCPKIMDLIMKYIKRQDIEFTTDEAKTLLITANYLGIRNLEYDCCQILKAHLNLMNCLDIWKFACASANNILQKKAYMYVLHHFEDIVWSPSSKFLELNLEGLCDILKEDELNIEQEKSALQAVIRWIKHKPRVRKQHIGTLLLKMRLALLNLEYLIENLNANLPFSSVWACKTIIALAMEARDHANSAGPQTRLSDRFTRPRLPYSILFAIGGFNGVFSTSPVLTYDWRLNNWMSVSSTETEPRGHHGTAFLDGVMYIIGGFDKRMYLNSMRRFNPLDGKWSEAMGMNSRRCFVSVAVLDGYIYAMGGFDGSKRLNTVERYDPSANEFSFILPMHERRSAASAATLNGRIYICGGYNGTAHLSTAECFDPALSQWTLIEPMHVRRSGLGVVVLNNRMFAIGGFDGTRRLQSAEVFDPYVDSWRLLTPMINPRSNFGIEVLDGLLYVVGGYGEKGIISKCECYHEGPNQWFHIQDLKVPCSAVSCCAVSELPNRRDYTIPREDLP